MITTILIGLACAGIGVWAGFRIAKKSGSFKKPILDVSLMNESLIREPEPLRQIIFGYSAAQNDQVFCYLPFVICNDGELSAKGVIMDFAFPRALRSGLSDDISYELKPEVYDKSLTRRKSSDIGGFQHVIYTLPELNPGTCVRVEELIDVVHASGMLFKVDAVSKNGVPLQVKGTLDWYSKVYVNISATDVMPIRTDFQVRSYRARDKEELGKEIMKEETRALREELSKMEGIPEWFVSSAYAPGLRQKAVVVMPKLKKIAETKKGSAFEEELEESERYFIKSQPPAEAPLLVSELARRFYRKLKQRCKF